MLDRVAGVLRELVLATPPNVGRGIGAMLEAWKVAKRFRALDLAGQRDVLDLFTKSAGEVLDRWFESAPDQGGVRLRRRRRQLREPLHARLGVRAAASRVRRGERRARPVGPRARRDGRDHAGDGGRMRGARRHAAHRRRGRARDRRRAARPRASSSRAARSSARAAWSRTSIRSSCSSSWSRPSTCPPTFVARIDGYRCGSGTFRMNVALSELPDFTVLPGKNAQPHHGSGIIIAPSLAYMERAYFDARTDGWSRAPIVEMLLPSVVDDSLAPPGMHVASLFCQHVHPDLGEVRPGRTWDDARDEVADLMIDTVESRRAEFQGERARPPRADAARSRARIRPRRRRHLPRRARARPAVLRAAGAGTRQLPLSGARPLHVRRRHASRAAA